MLGLLVVGSSALMALYNVAKVANDRVRLTHVADMVAYSGAVAQARSLNLLAYINRAQVSHHVAMAHLATLASLADFTNTQSVQRANVYPPARLMKSLFGAEVEQDYARTPIPAHSFAALEQAFHEHSQIVQHVLAKASSSIAENMTSFRDEVMASVLAANYPEYGLSRNSTHPAAGGIQLSVVNDEAPEALRRYIDHPDSPVRRHIAQEAGKYPFLQERKSVHSSHRMINPSCPDVHPEVRRYGHTRLDEKGHWVSIDTKSYRPVNRNRKNGCYLGEQPMGWGQVSPEGETSERGSSERDRDSLDRNPKAEKYANQSARHWQVAGLLDYYNVILREDSPSLNFRISLKQPIFTAPAMAALDNVLSRFGRDTFDLLHSGEGVTVTSDAESYHFEEQERGAGSVHDGLFQPYWHARLSAGQSTTIGDSL